VRERERLIARIRQIRRASPATTPRSPAGAAPAPDRPAVDGLETRVEHLEQLVEALQDSVYRESERYSKRFAEIEARIQPGALGRALSQDARERGL
jgi:hypothetical protein